MEQHKRHQTKSKPKETGDIPIYGGNGVLGYTNRFNNDTEVIIIGRVGAYCGSVFYENIKIWISDNAMFAKAKLIGYNKYLFYCSFAGDFYPRITASYQCSCLDYPFAQCCQTIYRYHYLL
jgi:restriction endonuclease S subunit